MSTVEELKKKIFVSLVFRGYPKIVVASTGRAGSTILYEAIADSLIKHRFPKNPNGAFARMIRRWCANFVVRISALPQVRYFVCKTHDVFDSPPDIECKYVFIYGDPLESAMSVQQVVESEGQAWFDIHQFHLRGNGQYSELYEKDVLNYQGQLESWLMPARENVICIDFDDLWDEVGRLSGFLGFSVDLPSKRSRKPKSPGDNINVELFMRLRNLKGRLKEQYLSSLER